MGGVAWGGSCVGGRVCRARLLEGLVVLVDVHVQLVVLVCMVGIHVLLSMYSW